MALISAKAQARAVRIDTKVSSIVRTVSNLTSTLNTQIDSTLDFTKFMHVNPEDDLNEADRAAASEVFNTSMSALNAALARLAPLMKIESEKQKGPLEGQAAVDEFVANHPMDVAAYSAQFDKA